jgi:predicted phage tail protein
MKKEDLIKLGLDETTAEKVAKASADELLGYIPKARFDEVNNAKNAYEAKVKEYNAKLDELTKNAKSTEEFQKQITDLKTTHEKELAEAKAKQKEISINSALKVALGGKVHDVDLASKLIDITKLEIDDSGNIKSGLNDQVKALKETKAFLFVPEKETETGTPAGFRIGAGGEQGKPGATETPGDLRSAVMASIQSSLAGATKK